MAESKLPPPSFGEKMADRVARFGGSWKFIGVFFTIMAIWIVANSVQFLWKPWDPYPFILFNLILSMLASIQAPIIMMSQNRQEARDRERVDADYWVDVRTEKKIDRMEETLNSVADTVGAIKSKRDASI
jgi:uncharacterized membrane protein